MPSTQRLSTPYYFCGNVKDLVISVELSFVGTMFGSLPSFEQFMDIDSHSGYASRAAHSVLPSLVENLEFTNTEKFGFASTHTEKRKIGWQEKIPKPNIINNEISIEGTKQGRGVISDDMRSTLAKGKINDDLASSDGLQTSGKDEQKSFSRIFTYVNLEVPREKTSGVEYLSLEESSIFRPKKISPLGSYVFKKPIVRSLPLEQHRKQNSLHREEQTMHIMAYLGSFMKYCNPNRTKSFFFFRDTDYDSKDECVVCKISVINSSKLLFEPDLGTFRIKSRHGFYSVTIHVENPLKFDRLIKADNLEPADDDLFGTEKGCFELPDNQVQWMQYLIVIENGVNFPHEGLFIEYQVELPSNVRIIPEEKISGRTQVCYSKEEEQRDVAYFSFPMEFILSYPMWNRHYNEILTWPRLLLRVLSEDNWQRFYVSGYASMSLPSSPGQYNATVNCWRVINPYSNLSAFKEFFLGQSVDLKSVKYAGSEDVNNRWASLYSKVGLHTESSGTINMTIHCIHQNRHYISLDVLRSLKYESIMQRIGMSGTMHWRIMKVLSDFEFAKRQLSRLQTMKIPFFCRN